MDGETRKFAEAFGFFGLGALSSALGLAGMKTFRKKVEGPILKQQDAFSAKEVGAVLLSFAVFMPESKWKFALAGAGAGMHTEELIDKFWKDTKLSPMTSGSLSLTGRFERDMRESALAMKYSKLIHYDPTLPLAEKEKIILPIFPRIIKEQRDNPLQHEAIQEYRTETGTSADRWTLNDSFWFQQWILHHGVYTANEGLWWGHDRFRTLAKLLRDRRQGKYTKNGQPAFEFDCVQKDEKVLVSDGMTYRAVPIKDLEPFGPWKAVSYNWFEKRFVFRDIRRVIPKGPLDAYRVYLKNGMSFIATNDHPVFEHDGEHIREVGVVAGKPRKVSTVLKLPELDTRSPLTDAQLWALGNYVAEGWVGSQGQIWVSSGKDPSIPSMLDAAGLDYTAHESSLKNGVVSYYLRKNDGTAAFRGFLAECGKGAHEKKFPSWTFGLPKRSIEAMLAGYAAGDGYVRKPYSTKDPREPVHRRLIYNTVSQPLTSDLRLSHMVLGSPLYSYYCEHSRGFTDSPIYRLYDNTNSRFRKPLTGYSGLGETAVARVEYIGKRNMYDITVDVDHNFVLAESGAIVSNCDDGDTSHNQLVDSYGRYPTYHLLISQKPATQGIHPLHHILPAVKAGNKMWAVETIKNYPIVPLEKIGRIFSNLQRAVLVYPDETWEELNDWKRDL